MAARYQITIDAQHPGKLAAFWAEALGYELEEDSPESIEAMRAQGYDPAERPLWEAGAVAPDGRGPRLYFQRPDSSPGSPRVHLDISVGPEDRDAEADRLQNLGARRLPQVRPDCVEMEDPEGNRFCVQ